MTIEEQVLQLSGEKTGLRDAMIDAYMPFIIARVADTINRYVETENDEAFLVGLSAFNEAIDRYVADKGRFLNFAGMVIRSRVTDWMRKQRYEADNVIYLEAVEAVDSRDMEEDILLKEEVLDLKKRLAAFGITFDDLVDSAPKRQSTKAKVTRSSKEAAGQPAIISRLYETGKLPIRTMVQMTDLTRKILKTYRDFIITVMVIVHEEYDTVGEFLIRDER